MKRLLFTAIMLATLVGVLVAPATADLITVEPDAYPNLTDISTLFPGVRLSIITRYWNDRKIYSLTSSRGATTGTQAFGWYYNMPGGSAYKDYWDGSVLRVDFDIPSTYVEISGKKNSRDVRHRSSIAGV